VDGFTSESLAGFARNTQLPEGEELIYVAGCPPIRGARVPYFRDPELARRSAIAPPESSEHVVRAMSQRGRRPAS
jgi:type IV secretory pathway TraG/TraD family ATPase VirD4